MKKIYIKPSVLPLAGKLNTQLLSGSDDGKTIREQLNKDDTFGDGEDEFTSKKRSSLWDSDDE